MTAQMVLSQRRLLRCCKPVAWETLGICCLVITSQVVQEHSARSSPMNRAAFLNPFYFGLCRDPPGVFNWSPPPATWVQRTQPGLAGSMRGVCLWWKPIREVTIGG
jgi:hypothetical protein